MEIKQHATKCIKEEIQNYLQTNTNESNFPKLRDAATAVLRGEFISAWAYFKQQEKSQINNINFHLKKLEKEQTKPKVSRKEEIIKIRMEINEIETKIKNSRKGQ